jgi:glycosyltransferase involved in cell wall biosynthesis
MAPLVTIVMCAYNTRAYIEQAVSSILKQTYENIELIISDDASNDGTWEWLDSQFKSHPRVRLFRHEQNLGYVENKNFALSRANGDLIAQCDSDDFYHRALVSRQVEVMTRQPEIPMVACGYHVVDELGRIRSSVSVQKDTIFTGYNGTAYPFWFPSILMKRDVYSQTGEYNPIFCGMGDDLYWVAKANERYSIYCLSGALYFYRQVPGSITKVLDSERKLLSTQIVKELLKQRIETGTDWIQQGDSAALRAYEQKLLTDRHFMAEQYRSWAARSIDMRTLRDAWPLLRRALSLDPLNKNLLRTCLYYIRAQLTTNLTP